MNYGNYAPFYRSGFFNPMQVPAMQGGGDMFNPYQQTPPQTPLTAPQSRESATNEFIWVQGEAGAKAYLVGANNTVILWDTESPTIYIKTADASGIPSMRVLDFTERPVNAPKTPNNAIYSQGVKYVAESDFNALRAAVDELQVTVDEIKNKPAKKATKEGNE